MLYIKIKRETLVSLFQERKYAINQLCKKYKVPYNGTREFEKRFEQLQIAIETKE